MTAINNNPYQTLVRGLPSLRQLEWCRDEILHFGMRLLKQTKITADDIKLFHGKDIKLHPVEFTLDRGNSVDALEAFTAGIFIADIFSYPKPSDQVELSRLSDILYKYRFGFTLAYISTIDKNNGKPFNIPLGYTGWFPIHQDVFTSMEQGHLTDRRIIRPVEPEEPVGGIYLFNFSVIPSLKSANLPALPNQPKIGKMLMENLNQQLDSYRKVNKNCKGICAITVSDDGTNQCQKKFKMHSTGIVQDGSGEKIWIKKYE